jgi:putative restriction endonuclease
MEWEELLEAIGQIRCSPQGGGRRAKHKPLLLLWALGNWRAERRRVRFDDWSVAFTTRLRQLAIPRAGKTPEMPFCKLQRDTPANPGCLWRVEWDHAEAPDDATADQLRSGNAVGSFLPEVQALLGAGAGRVTQLADQIMAHHFSANDGYTPEHQKAIRIACDV